MTNIIRILLEAEQLEGTQATVAHWLVNSGDKVKKDQPIVDLETDKVAIEITAPEDGIIADILCEVGKTICAGDELATLNTASQLNQALTSEALQSTTSNSQQDNNNSHIDPINTKSKKHLLGPAVKRLLSEHSLTPDIIKGSGTDERITKKDVQQHIAQSAELPSSLNASASEVACSNYQTKNTAVNAPDITEQSTKIPHSSMRKAIANHMVDSLLNTSPHVTSIFEMDLTAIIAHRSARKLGYQDAGANLTFTAYFLIASARAIEQVPEINSQFHSDALEIFKQVNIGVGTALDDKGLVVPVVKNVAHKNLFQLAKDLTEQTEKARNRQLTANDMQGGTFTISNYGVSGSLIATPIIINQPQVAILGVGKMEKRVVVRNKDNEDKMVIKPMCYVSLSIDHRALDAHQTNKFLAAFVNEIENWPAQ
jgi:2-oxoglutarate dehydrogenase E2 component (dihydrolipoamide succinyltransferase)